MRKKEKTKEKLVDKMISPRYGFGQMHYSSLSVDAVKKAFESSSAEFKLKHRLNIPRRAYDIVEHGKGCKIDVVGTYWVIEEI